MPSLRGARAAGALAVFLVFCATRGFPVQNAPLPPAPSLAESTNSQDVIAMYLQLQADLRATQQAIEQNQKDARAAATQAAATLSNGLQGIQEAFALQRAQDLQALRKSNDAMLLTAGLLAAIGFLTMLLLTWLQWRMSRDLAEISAALPASLRWQGGAAELPAPGGPAQAQLPHAFQDRPSPPVHRAHKGLGWSIERRLFPKATDAFRRRQFRALKTALVVGLFFALLVAGILYLVYTQRGGT